MSSNLDAQSTNLTLHILLPLSFSSPGAPGPFLTPPVLGASASITKYRRLGGVNNRYLVSHSSRLETVQDQGVSEFGSF